MVQIHPFQAVHYSSKAGDLSSNVALPYDQIDDRLRERYYTASPHNVVRIIRGRPEADDREGNDLYSRAAEFLREWRGSGILARRERPAIYPYHQEYEIGGRRLVRRGFSALLRLEELGRGAVFPHENTFAAPKADRLALLRATGAHFGHIFLLYDDPARADRDLLAGAESAPPILEARHPEGQRHRVWALEDPRAIEAVRRYMASHVVLIADGHHRYETALAFSRERRAAGGSEGPPTGHGSVMATFINARDEGLTVLPTHRLVNGSLPAAAGAFQASLRRHFEVRRFDRAEELLSGLAAVAGRPAFGVVLPGEAGGSLALLRDGASAAEFVPGEGSSAFKGLDVVILHRYLLPLLGVTEAEVSAREGGRVAYLRSAEEAVARVASGASSAAFLLKATRVAQVFEVARGGERLPRKSTDFWPKLLSGLLMHQIDL